MSSAVGGLAGVVAGQTGVSLVDGEASRLVYRGYSIEELAGRTSYEEVSHLLLRGTLPTTDQLTALCALLQEEQETTPLGLLRYAQTLAQHGTAPLDALRATLAQAATSDPEARDKNAREAVCLRLIARTPVLLAAATSRRDPAYSYAPAPFAQSALAGLLRREVSTEEAADFDTLLVLHAEHSFNASTFTARVVASTEADPYSAVIAALGALSGPLHGGANADAARMIADIGAPENADAYVQAALETKRKIAGFGHRVYKTGDPRARVLQQIAERHAVASSEAKRRYETALAVETAINTRKANLYPNVDFFASVVFTNLGIAPALMTPVFAVARMAGWTAHVLEQYAQSKLIRPDAEYVGPIEQRWRPLSAR